MTIRARYPGRCSTCGGRINPGDEIEWDQRTRQTSHITCPATTSAAPVPASDSSIKVSFASRSRNGSPTVGEVITTPKGDYVVVLRVSSEYISADECEAQDDFTNDGNAYWSHTARCTPATDEESAPLRGAKQAEADRKAAKTRAQEIARMIRESGERPQTEPVGPNDKGYREDYRPGLVLEGDKILDTQNAYGGGEWFVISPDGIWYVQNNGGDGDMWDVNNVRTGGAGAIGWRIPANEAIETEIRKLAEVLK